MQQEIKLTNESSNTVFVDDVDVSKGVIVYSDTSLNAKLIGFVSQNELGHVEITSIANSKKLGIWEDLWHAIKGLEDKFFYSMLDNKRIVTEREVTIDDLKNTDHVGFVDSLDDKGYVVCSSYQNYISISSNNYGSSCNGHYGGGKNHETIVSALSEVVNPQKIYRFTTRKELYQWLAE